MRPVTNNAHDEAEAVDFSTASASASMTVTHSSQEKETTSRAYLLARLLTCYRPQPFARLVVRVLAGI